MLPHRISWLVPNYLMVHVGRSSAPNAVNGKEAVAGSIASSTLLLWILLSIRFRRDDARRPFTGAAVLF